MRRLIRLRAPNQVVRDWVKVNYANLMDQSFGEASLAGYSVDWVLPEESFNPKVQEVVQDVLPQETDPGVASPSSNNTERAPILSESAISIIAPAAAIRF